MLTWLRIQNLVLIQEAEIDFSSGLTVVTGETGAGKTIFAQAIGLLLGQKAEASLVGPNGKEAFVQAEFSVDEALWSEADFAPLLDLRPEEGAPLTLARKVSSDGRSRAYAWNMSITKDQLAGVAERLIAVSGQFEQRRLAKPAYQLDLLDAFVGEKQLSLRLEAGEAWKRVARAKKHRDEVARNAEAAQMRLDEMKLLVEQTADFTEGEEENLKKELDRISRAKELVDSVMSASEMLSPEEGRGAADLAAEAERLLDPVKDLDEELSEAVKGLIDAESVLREIASSLRSFLDKADAEPGRIQEVEYKLSRILETKRRFREPNYAELLSRALEAAAELEQVGIDGDPLAAAEKIFESETLAYKKIAASLRKARQDAASKFAKAAQEELRNLAMGSGEMKVEVSEKSAGPSGADDVTFLIRPNAGMPFAPASHTASGGELSRVALALRVVSHSKVGEPTILFDEIDAGIGGVTAHAVAASLKRLSETTQVISITHLPQIASQGDDHLRIEKIAGDLVQTQITTLSPEERKAEIERMLGGSEFLEKISS